VSPRRLTEVKLAARQTPLYNRSSMGDAQPRHVILVQSDGSFLAFPCPPAGSMPSANVAQVESIVPSAIARNIAAIAHTALVTGQQKPLAIAGEKTMRAAGQAIPFFGMLLGLAYIGHKVRVFDGSTPPLQSGCKDADVLIVDNAVCGKLPQAWQTVACAAMRNANIFMHDRKTFQLAIIHKVGEAQDRIDFAQQ
jgi:hypothetical protein